MIILTLILMYTALFQPSSGGLSGALVRPFGFL
jgi:hypothetical protein